MRLTKDLFFNLKQLDRIEYRQREERISKLYYSNFTGIVLALGLGVFIIGSLFIGLCWGGETMILFMKNFKNNLDFMSIAFLFAIFGDILLVLKRKQELVKLEDEFFEVKLKESSNGKKRR